MGQILSWIRGPREGPALQDVAAEEQVCVCVMSNKSESFHVLFCVIAVRREVLACIACVSSCVFKKGGNGRLSLPLSLSLLECEANGQSLSVQSFSLSFAVEPY